MLNMNKNERKVTLIYTAVSLLEHIKRKEKENAEKYGLLSKRN